MSDDAIMSIILRALPREFENFLVAFKLLSPETRTLNHLISNVISRARELEGKKKGEGEALMAKSKYKYNKNKSNSGRPEEGKSGPKSKPKPGNCNFCKKPGHWKADCEKLKRKIEKEKKPETEHNESKQPGPVADFCEMALTEDKYNGKWIVDSGASLHMTPNFEWFENLDELDEPRTIRFGNNETLRAVAKGNIRTTKGLIRDVYYVPKMVANLFSIGEAVKRGLTVNYCGDIVKLNHKDEVKATGKLGPNNIYVLDLEVITPETLACAAHTLEKWHRILGHISTDNVTKMKNSNVVEGLDFVGKERECCEDCALGKCKRASHRTRTTPRANKPGSVLHVDSVPSDIPSLNKAKHYVLCKDEFSDYRMVDFVESKGQVADKVKLMITKAKLETGNQVLMLHSDNGTELMKDLTSYLSENGIIKSTSAPHTPNQNGFIERDVATVTKGARVLLSRSKLPKPLWAEATNTMVYILNRIVSSGKRVTPYELWFGNRPSVANMHEFGESVVNRKVRPEGRWDDRGVAGKFVGYGNRFNTFRIFRPHDGAVIVTCDVVFLNKEVKM